MDHRLTASGSTIMARKKGRLKTIGVEDGLFDIIMCGTVNYITFNMYQGMENINLIENGDGPCSTTLYEVRNRSFDHTII